MKKLLVILPLIIILSFSCSSKITPNSSDALVVAKAVEPDKPQFPWYQWVAGSLLLTILITSINNEQ